MTLESAYNGLEPELSYTPRGNISVFSVTEQDLLQAGAPDWTHQSMKASCEFRFAAWIRVNSGPARILKHELAPSFINQMSGGRRPRWLHKGIAQARPEEPGGRSAYSKSSPFNRKFHSTPSKPTSYNSLRVKPCSPMTSLWRQSSSSPCLRVSELPGIPARIGEGSPTEAALPIHEITANGRPTSPSIYRIDPDTSQPLGSPGAWLPHSSACPPFRVTQPTGCGTFLA